MGTVSKALSLLDFFSLTRESVGLSELARLSGMNKATVHRLMSEMQARGFVEQTGAAREYRLGPAFLRLAALREAAVPMREVADAVLADLSRDTHETSHVSLLQGETLTTLSYAYSPLHRTRVAMEDAEVLTLHNTSSGLAVLAFSPPAFVDAVLSRPLARPTPDTETDPAAIRARLGPIRASGMAESIGSFEADVHSHAMPLFDAASRVTGAIAVAAPAARMTAEHRSLIRSALRRHALHLTRAMGGLPPDDMPEGDLA